MQQGLFDAVDENHPPKKQKRHQHVVFKPTLRDQSYLLPPSLDELIGTVCLPRFIDTVVDKLDTESLQQRYQGGGTSSYHPTILLKIWLLGWCRRLYTSRPLAAALGRDIEFMWISGMQRPSHMTLNTFRMNLDKDIKQIFREIVKLALEAGVMDGRELYIDHTKMEADANRHKITWAKSIDRYMSRVDEDLDKVIALIDRLNLEENRKADDEAATDATRLSPEQLDRLIGQINERIKSGQVPADEGRQAKEMMRKGKMRLTQRQVYTGKKEALAGRNSMSNTDPDATAMMQKDGVSIKPGYNVGIATQEGIVTGYDVSNNSNDSTNFTAVLDDAVKAIGYTPERVCADAGYGCLETYELLGKSGIAAYVKYRDWYREVKNKRDPFDAASFIRHTDDDSWECPNGIRLTFSRLRKQKNRRTGYEEVVREYAASVQACSACPLKAQCTKYEFRRISVNERLRDYCRQARERLNSDTGKRMRSQRSVEVETVFGIAKQNARFRRFHVRGLSAVSTECGLFFSTLNIRRMYGWFLGQLTGLPRIPVLT